MIPLEISTSPKEIQRTTKEFEAIRSVKADTHDLTVAQSFVPNESDIVVASYDVFTHEQPLRNLSRRTYLNLGSFVRFVSPESAVQVMEDITDEETKETVSRVYLIENDAGAPVTHEDSPAVRDALSEREIKVIDLFSTIGLIDLSRA